MSVAAPVRDPATAPSPPARRLPAAWLWVAAAVAWNLVHLRAETLAVTYLDDGSVHEQMVRFATAQLRPGHLPLTSWFPYLGLGSPQFLHYQSLPAMLTGLVGLAVGPDVAYRWSLYLLLSFWPVSVYLGARLFRLPARAAAAAAALAPFLVTAAGVGYEQKAYVWIGYGVWTQLWASMTLPLAWGLSWRAIRSGRGYAPAVLATALTCALHFETGYLAVLPLVVWPLVRPGRAHLAPRIRRAAVVVAGTVLAAAWVIVPLILQGRWAATNQVLQETPLVNGYGAGRVLGWLVTGQLLDDGRLPVITALAAVGFVLTARRWRRDDDCRALLTVLALTLVLSFGRATLGPVVDIIPGGHDLFFRRFMMGTELAALLLAGAGGGWCAGRLRAGVQTLARHAPGARRLTPAGAAFMVAAAAVLITAPAWRQLGRYDAANAAAIDGQRAADVTQGAQVDRLAARAARAGGGRVYAGMPSNWGANFTVGSVPVFKYLESRDADEVGYTLRTASLMTIPEFFFDEGNPADYRLFGILYLILPAGRRPPVPARRMAAAGPYRLWTVMGGGGYVHAGTVVGAVAADRSDVGTRTRWVLHRRLASAGLYIQVAFDRDGRPVRRSAPAPPPAGTVTHSSADLADGAASAVLRMARPGVAVLSASFDPGWAATVDGRPAARPPIMIAPALVGVRVPAGVHRVAFRYRGFGWYPELLALAVVALLGLVAIDRRSGSQGDEVGR